MTTPSELTIEHWDVHRPKPHPRNAKVHTKEMTKTLAATIKATGRWTQPIVVRGESEHIIAGHGRQLAAIELGRKTIPVVVLWGLTDAEEEALRLSDNKVTSQVYDTEKFREALTFISDSGEVDMTALGVDDKELSFLTEDPGIIDDSAFVDDITAAVENQKTENDAKTAAIDAGTTRTGEAFGFNKLSVAQGRRVKSFMGRIEGETGLKGPDALMRFLDELGLAA